MIPESRKDEGLMLGRPIVENVSIGQLNRFSRFGLVERRKERQATARVLTQVAVPAARGRDKVRTLSGGNQQKVLMARVMLGDLDVLIADEPTRGVDIGAKAAIYELLLELAAQGVGVLLISSEMEEVIGLAHRVVVLHRGRVSDELEGADVSEERILAAAFSNAREGGTVNP